MNFIKQNPGVIAVVALIIAIIGVFTPIAHSGLVGFTPSSSDITSTRYTQLTVDNGIFNTAGFEVFNGVTYATVRQSFVSGTTTPCSIQNPINATSTLANYSYNITVGTSTPANGINWIVGTTTTSAFATTTNMIASEYVKAGALDGVSWDPGVNNAIVGPGSWVNVGALASSSITGTGGIIVTGTCQATFYSAN